jgi:hypothetical protein
MRHDAGFVAFHLAFAVPGMALLYALGLVRRARDVPAAIGPAYLAGVAAVMSLLMLGLVLGAGIRLPQLAAVAGALTLALAATGFVMARRGADDANANQESPAPAGAGGFERWAGWVACAALGAFFVVGISAFSKVPTVGDDWAMWSYKALAFFHFDGELRPEVFAGTEPGPAHLEYPVLLPLFESLFFRAIGQEQVQEWHSVLWILFGSFVWTAAWLVRSRGFPLLIVMVPVIALALTRRSAELIELGFADTPLACFAGAAILAFGLWLSDGGARYALLGAVFLAGAANTKNEGVMVAFVLFLAAAAVFLATRRPAWRTWGAGIAITAAAAAPWMIWRSSKGLESTDVRGPLESLAPGLLIDKADRVPRTFRALIDQLAVQDLWVWVVPALLVLSVVCLIRGTARREAAFYLSVTLLLFLGLVFTYWTGKREIGYWLWSSADRTVISVVFASGVGLIHLMALVIATIRPREPDPALTSEP